MELQTNFISFPVLISFLVLFLTFLKLRSNRKSAWRLPPGPPRLPIIGNTHQLMSPLPHRTLRDLASKYGPLMHLKMGEVSTVVFSSVETAKEVLKTHDVVFASRPPILVTSIMSYNCTSITSAPYGEYWRQLRKICILELLSAKRVLSFRSMREDLMADLVQWARSRAGTSINLSEKIYSSQYAMTSTAAFGKKSPEQEKFIAVIKEAIKFVGGFNIADMFPSIKLLEVMSGMRPKIEKLHNESNRILEDIIQGHKKAREGNENEQEEDLVDVLLKVQKQGDLQFPLTTDNIKAVILDIFSAGSETPATAADWVMSELIKNPKMLQKAQTEVREVFNRRGQAGEEGLSELKYLQQVVKEALRLHPPVPLLLPRLAAETREICGYTIPVKTKGIINAWALGRDPNCWNDPETFDPERFNDTSVDFKGNYMEYIPFGAGRRICPGMTFGLVQVELQIAMLLYHFDWKLPGGMKNEDLDMTETFAVTVRRKDDLHLIPTPYVQPQVDPR
ncbi:premnaspirodiene oxygenase-like [Punica granatum]|uniref:Uncharacterized protein n=2 Tax=Punica granatum TaxID=22663 RepID=A0A218XM03_PUNGR|nr:premnaspirodiene oxygenase-like [Punica granatum]OWM85820.1 hypothetical protein CDL15_Pgr012070 [Punica granatum]PKI77494.1 hypothetical protein CRG98_002100 [Punica granatum]